MPLATGTRLGAYEVVAPLGAGGMGPARGVRHRYSTASQFERVGTEALRCELAHDPLPLVAAIGLDGPGDLRSMLAAEQRICGRPVITELMGGSPVEQPNRYRAGSPIELLPAGTRLEFLMGRVFGAQNEAYQAAATKAGDTVQATTTATAGHFMFIDPQSDVWPQVMAAVRRTLGK